jgi:hypothetical protein
MDIEKYISSSFRRILSENLEEKTESLMNKLNYDETLKLNKDKEFDYVQEGKQTCNECGSKMMYEGECKECGWKGTGEVMERKGKSKVSAKDIEDLLGDIKHDMGKDKEENEFEFELELDEKECVECGSSYEMKEKLYGKQKNIDKNRNGKIDSEDFKMLRKQQDEGEQLYEVEFDKEMEEGETEEGNAFTGALADAKKKGDEEFEVDGKKYNVKESILYTESDLIDLIESIVKEEKKKFSTKEPKGYKEYERAHKADKKENDDYLKSVAKKMSDYLKGSSDSGSKYEMKETEKFPTENGGLKKGIRKKYTPSDAVDDYEDAFSYPGMTNLVFDEIKPNEKNIEKYLKGHKTTGNAQVDDDGKALGNVVPSEVGDKFFQNFKDNLYGQEQMDASYKRQPQPVDQAGEDTERGSLKSKRGKKTSQSVLNKVDEGVNEKEVKKLNEEFERIQNLMGYSRKTQ